MVCKELQKFGLLVSQVILLQMKIIMASYRQNRDAYEGRSKILVTTMIYGKANNGDTSRDWDYDEKNGVVGFTTLSG